jgi:hypothetical protein
MSRAALRCLCSAALAGLAEHDDRVTAIDLRGVWACIKHELRQIRAHEHSAARVSQSSFERTEVRRAGRHHRGTGTNERSATAVVLPKPKEERMKRLLAGGCAVALVAGVGAGAAIGQGGGGTVGPGAVGSKTLEVRVKENQINVNCGNLPQNRCFRRGPRLGNVVAGNGAIYDGNTRVGTAIFANIVGRRIGRTGSQDVFLATIAFNNRADSMAFMGPSIGAENAPTLPYAIVGGTGTYAGARGSVIEGEGTERRGEFRIPLNLTFIP